MKHTAGPWEVADGRDILSTQPGAKCSGPLVAVVDDNDDRVTDADARLIAAAPELLIACEKLVEAQRRADVGATGGFDLYVDAVEAAQTALKKVRGET